jgi:hypothetical protein
MSRPAQPRLTVLVDDVLACEQRRCRALGEHDVGALDALTAADYVHIHADGRVQDRATWFDHLARSPARETIRENLTVRRRGNVAIVTGDLRTTLRPEGQPPLEIVGVATGVWSLRGDVWEHVSFQVTRQATG